jgi:hypothetical protein
MKLFAIALILALALMGTASAPASGQDPLNVAPVGDKHKELEAKNDNILAEGLPHRGLRGNAKTGENFHFGCHSSHE